MRVVRVASWLLPCALAAYLVSFKLGWFPSSAPAMLGLASASMLALLITMGWDLVLVVRGPSRLASIGRALVKLGIVVAFAAGTANWAYGFQGVVFLREGHEVPLNEGKEVEWFNPGPLVDFDELDLRLGLLDVELLPGPTRDQPSARSTLRIESGGERRRVQLTPGAEQARHGSIRLIAGEFGFAPHLLLKRGEKLAWDEKRPLRSYREASGARVFADSLKPPHSDLTIEAWVRLDTLDENMRGHPVVRATVRRGGAVLGQGDLRLGHAAEVGEGYQLTLAGLDMWTEIQLVRQLPPYAFLTGVSLIPLGVLVWLAGRRWRR